MSRAAGWLKAIALAVLVFAGNSQGQVIISEFMASNTRTLADEDGDYSDWVEIFNLGQTDVNLLGWALTDNTDNPRKWRFPAMEIKSGQAMVVFASNKNRRVAGNPLHTDFKLSSSGGFIGISDASGKTVFHYGAIYPDQAPDVSFGVVWEEEQVAISAATALTQYVVPGNDALGIGWTLPEFPSADWASGNGPVGFDQNGAAPADPWVATIMASNPAIYYRFQETGGTTVVNQGSLGTTYNSATANGTLINQTGVRPPEALGMPADNTTPKFDGSNDYINSSKPLLNNLAAFTMSGWVRPSALTKARVGLWGQHDAIEFGFIDAKLLQLSTGNGGAVQADFPYAANTWCWLTVTGDGEALRIYVDGVLAGEGGSPTENYGASGFSFVMGGNGIFDPSQNWFTGNIDEFAFYTRALGADEIYFQYQMGRNPASKYSPGTTLAGMKGVNSSVYLRQEINSSSQVEGLQLKAQFDDGFIAYLNGVEVARVNVPTEPVWNSAATVDRPRAVGLATQTFDLTSYLGLLHEGSNLLAVHGLNSAVDNADFFFGAELAGVRRKLNTNLVRYFAPATPEKLNGVGDTNSGPLIVSPTHSPAIPTTNDAITVTAKMLKTFYTPSELTLTYKLMFAVETTIPMLDDGLHGDGAAGDGEYGATIPGSIATQGQMIRWYFKSKDINGNTSRWPLFREALNSPQYLGTVYADARQTNNLPVLSLFVQNTAASDGTGGTRAAVFWKGILYDNIYINVHGQSSQSFPKKSYNLDFNTGYHFLWDAKETPVEDINLLTIYPDKAHVRNVLAYETFRDAGHPYHFVVPVRVERNGAFFADAHMVEDGDADYLARVGLNPNGALYKMYNTLDSATSGAEKKTRRFENNTDLTALITGLGRTGASLANFVYDNVDVPGMVNYLAAMVLTGNVDCCHKNYYIYRDSEGTGEWKFLPWDVDLSFGRNWTSSLTYFDDTMYSQNGLFIGQGNKMGDAMFNTPSIRQMYLRRLRTLLEDIMQAPGTPAADLKYEKRVRELYEQIAPDAALDYAKWATWGTKQTMPQALAIMTNQYMPARRNFLFVTQKNTIPAAITNDLNLNFGAYEVNPVSGSQQQEYFTLVNTNKVALDISGWKIEGAVEFTFAPGTVLPTNGTVYVSPSVVGFRQRATNPRAGQGLFIQGNYKGQLSARGGTVTLKDRKGRVVNALTIPAQPTAGQLQLRITEILYAPPANSASIPREELEYVVLKNIGASAINLKGVSLTNAISFTFNADVLLSPAESIYVVKNPDAFGRIYGGSFKVAGPFAGQLANEGERLELYDSAGELVLDFSYENEWIPITETRGHSLVIADEQSPYTAWDLPASWTFSPLPGGSAAMTLAKLIFQNTYFTEEELADPLVGGGGADPDGDGLTNDEEFVVGSDPRSGASALIVGVSSLVGTSLQIEVAAVAGRVYSVWSATDLSGWTRETTEVRATATGPLRFSFSTTETAGKYLRVRAGL